ncbi:SDR family oxidoreductase [Hoyosella sp. G463]|uniref:SDR family oxidoreductase n=1 Tax=Lolliginicoccus lacisalsi TaxID=2742202 RepID=A0A927JDJ7_9ACTN|nr:SDR family NAD(P)-dependent oxidoreductase [Lolliginicoccus lacisalsi]MBD8506672.1 SDR family oxidoreductase [Lolliginicoccus lacisalsi]
MGRYPRIPLDDAIVVLAGVLDGTTRILVEELHELGAIVWLGTDDVAQASIIADDLGPGVFVHELDLVSSHSWAGFRDRVLDVHDRIDAAVLNPPVPPPGSFLDDAGEAGQPGSDHMVRITTLAMRAMARAMARAGRGHVVALAPVSGISAAPGQAASGAGAAAIVALCRSVRLELLAAGVSVTALLSGSAPGEVAHAVLRSWESRPAQLVVPRYMWAWALVQRILPDPLVIAIARRWTTPQPQDVLV